MRKDIQDLAERVIRLEDKKFDTPLEMGYNKYREAYIENMIKSKLVYNAHENEWDKLREYEG